MKPWTTASQLAWLQGQIPQWQKAHRENKVRAFLEDTSTKFFEDFSVLASDQVAGFEVRPLFYPSPSSNVLY